jgi:hypothetical protein
MSDKPLLKLSPIEKIGSKRTGSLVATYEDITDRLGEPNVTHLDDPDKVKASWGFQDQNGREAFIWCYNQSDPIIVTIWSTNGDQSLLDDVFEWNERIRKLAKGS